LGLASLFQATDPDGDPITQYQLWDPLAGDGGFTTNGSPLPARGVVTVFPAGVSSVAWDTTGQSGSAVFAVRAFDGSLWSDWTTIAVNDAPAPGLAAPARLVQALASDAAAAPVTAGPLPVPGDAIAPLPLAATVGHP
jgi:hypothetical protein